MSGLAGAIVELGGEAVDFDAEFSDVVDQVPCDPAERGVVADETFLGEIEVLQSGEATLVGFPTGIDLV